MLNLEFATDTNVVTGAFTLAGAVVGVLGGIIIAGIYAWNQRSVDRNQALRSWKLQQLQPTLDFANESLAQIGSVNRDYLRVKGTRDRECWTGFLQKIEEMPTPFGNLSHSTVVARLDNRAFTPLLFAFLEAYNDCLEELSNNAAAAYGACLMGQAPASVRPSSESIDRLLNTVLDLNQATERYVFGKGSPLTFAEVTNVIERRQRMLNRLQRRKQGSSAALTGDS